MVGYQNSCHCRVASLCGGHSRGKLPRRYKLTKGLMIVDGSGTGFGASAGAEHWTERGKSAYLGR